MKKIFLLLLVIFLCLSFSFGYAEDVVKMSVNITEKTYKEKYDVGDTVIIDIKVVESCEKLGLLIGTVEYNSSLLSFIRANKGQINIYSDELEEDISIQTKYLNVGINEKENQIIFWIEDDQNRLKEGTIGSVVFKTKKEINASDMIFKLAKLEASDYDLKNQYAFEVSNKDEMVSKVENSGEQLIETLNDLKENLNEEKQNLILENVENTQENNNNNSKEKNIEKVEKESNKKDELKIEEKDDDTSAKIEQKEINNNTTENTATKYEEKVTEGNSKNSEKIDNSSSKTETKKDDKKVEDSSNDNPKPIWVNSSSWAETELYLALTNDLVPETFNNMDFTKPITRKEFAAVAVKLYEKLMNKEQKFIDNNSFTDTKDEYVLKAYAIGITEGTDKEKKLFSPEKEITREQMATMLFRTIEKANIDTKVDIENAIKFEDDGEMHTWGRNAIYFMSLRDIIKGISRERNIFGVKNNATVEQALLISNRCFEDFKN